MIDCSAHRLWTVCLSAVRDLWNCKSMQQENCPHEIFWVFLHYYSETYICQYVSEVERNCLRYSVIIVIIIKTVSYEPQPSLEHSVRFHPVFTSLDFATIFCFYGARRRWLDNTTRKIYLREIGWDDVDWIDLAQDTSGGLLWTR
jgi:hypothetical protein